MSPTRVVDGIELPAAGTWAIDPGHAQIGFVGRHLKFTKVRGRFRDVTGAIHVTEDPNETTVEVTIDMASVESGNPTRDDHLRSADLFDVDEFPTATFTGQARNWVGAQGDWRASSPSRTSPVPVVLDVEYHGFVTDPWGGDRIVFSATGTIDREDWGVTWNMPLEAGGLLVSKRIDLEFELEAVYERSAVLTRLITRDELRAALEHGNIVLLEALPTDHYTREHLPGARNLPLDATRRARAATHCRPAHARSDLLLKLRLRELQGGRCRDSKPWATRTSPPTRPANRTGSKPAYPSKPATTRPSRGPPHEHARDRPRPLQRRIPHDPRRGDTVTVTRLGSTKGLEPLPTISQLVLRGRTVYTLGVTGDPRGDITDQTNQVLQRIDALLAKAGTDKSRLLTAQVWLADMRDFEAHNRAWNNWVDPDNPPVRACVQAGLWQPGLLVEIMVTAATTPSLASGHLA